MIGLEVRRKDKKKLKKLLALVPDDVSFDILAYNLACYYATKSESDITSKNKNKSKTNKSNASNKDIMLKYIKKSMELGTSGQQFLDDTDFDAYLDDIDFKTAISVADEVAFKSAKKKYEMSRPYMSLTTRDHDEENNDEDKEGDNKDDNNELYQSVIISQLRLYDTKRLQEKIDTLDKEDFNKTKTAIKKLL